MSTDSRPGRDWSEEITELRAEVEQLRARCAGLADRLFAAGAMREAPCFACGYNGAGYYQPATHPCAARHHALYAHEPGPGVDALAKVTNG